jgi:two-component system cell cycle response regulator
MAKARILAVDDQRYFRELIAGMLAEEGFEAQTASSGEEALHILENSDFDVVLTDLVMPGMDGSELVHRIKQRDPDQDVVVVTGVVDVKTAVDAMKLGASDYLLKPFDRRTLAVTLETLLQGRRLESEHARLLAENIEYIGERTLYERALGCFSALAIEPLAMRVVEALCLETRAQGGVIWIAGDTGGEVLDLAAARGLVRVADEPEAIAVTDLPAGLAQGPERTALAEWGDGDASGLALYAALRREGRVVGVVRLTDKLEGEEFDSVDRACVEKFLRFADVAVTNALRVRALERRSLQDPGTGAYSFDYFQDVVRNEIEKANRFGRRLALIQVDLGPLDALRRSIGEEDLRGWLAGVSEQLARMLRATDLLAADGAQHFYMLLPEADGLGAAALKRRALRALERSELFAQLAPEARPRPRLGIAIYPSDGVQLEALLRALGARIAEQESSRVTRLGLERMSLAAALQALVRYGSPERPEIAEQIARFVLSEAARRPRERNLLYAAPGRALSRAVREGLEALSDVETRTDVVVIAEGEAPTLSAPALSWVSERLAPGLPPCLIHYGDGAAYALVREEGARGAPARLFHTSDRNLVEHLAFRLQEEIAVPPTIGREDRA